MKKIIKNKDGFSFIELMIAIAIIMLISAAFVVNIRVNTQEDIRAKTEKVAADIRYIRNLAISRAEYQFEGQTEEEKTYPPGGYGVYFNGNQDKYIIFADNGNNDGYQSAEDEALYEVSVDPFVLDDKNGPLSSFYFTFVSEHEVVTSMSQGLQKQYTLNLREDIGVYGTGYQGSLILGEVSSDGYVWSNIGTSYGTFNIPKPTPPPPDPPEMEMIF
ncbi:hypothetical protein C0580_01640 [Candidatus Parcubacteria bacterium]|nr:MAG: hypothetical protein C0580_01640 [Candidatus Parcubacteria bacterium]